MSLHVGVGSVFKDVPSLYVGVGSAWKAVSEGYVGVGGVWRQFFPGLLAAPANLIATTVGVDEIALVWDAVAGVDGYKVERSPNGTSGWTQVHSTTSTFWSDTGLIDGTEYFYRVRAYIGATDGAYSSVDSAVTTLAPPVLYSLALGSSDPTTEVDAAFDDGGSGSETEIRIYVSTTGNSSGFSLWDTAAANAISRTLTGLTPDVQIWVRLKNYNAVAGESAFSGYETITLGGVPAAPTGLIANDIGTAVPDDGKVRLTWTDNSSDETSFSIERDDGGGFFELDTVGPNVTLYDDDFVTNGETYTYRVRAHNAAGYSGYSNAPTITPVGE